MDLASGDKPLFAVPLKGSVAALSYGQLAARLKKWTSHLKLEASRFIPHCLRRGGATWAFTVDIPSEAI